MSGTRVLLLAVAFVAVGANSCRAALVLEVRPTLDTNVEPGDSGFFDLYVVGGDPFTDFDVTIGLLNNPVIPQVTFSGFQPPFVDPSYVFFPLFPAVSVLGDGTQIRIQGSDLTPVTPGLGRSLARLFFDVTAIDPSELPKVFQIEVADSVFYDATTGTFVEPAPSLGDTIGTITVQDLAPVPEPSSLALLGLCGVAGGGAAWRRRRKAAAGVVGPAEIAA